MTKVVFEEKYYPAVKEMVYRTLFVKWIDSCSFA